MEPSGAASFAGLLANSQRHGQAVAVMSGGNVNLRQIDTLRADSRTPWIRELRLGDFLGVQCN